MIFFIITRILDLITTLLNTNKWGWEVEGNPLMFEVGSRGLIIPYQIILVVLVILVSEKLPRYKKYIYGVMSIAGLMISVSNLLCFLLIV